MANGLARNDNEANPLPSRPIAPPPSLRRAVFSAPRVDVKHMAPLSPTRLHFITLRQHFPPSSTKAEQNLLTEQQQQQSVSQQCRVHQKKKVDACVRKDRFKCRHRVIQRPSKCHCFCFRLSRKFFCVGFLRRWPTNMVPLPSSTDGAFSRRRIEAWATPPTRLSLLQMNR